MKRKASSRPRHEIRKKTKRSKAVQKFQATKLFVTYPQNEIKKEELIENILEKYPNTVEWIIACNEDHAPTEEGAHGGIHSHLIMKFKKRIWIYHDIWEEIGGGKRGKYECMKGTMYDAMTYIMKNGDYTSWGISNLEKMYEKLKKKKSPKELIVSQYIFEGKSNKELMQDPELGGFVSFRLRTIDRIREEVERWKASEYVPKYTIDENISPDRDRVSEDLFNQLKLNLTEPRKHRQRHIYIYAEKGVGKTVLLEQLGRRFKLFSMPTGHPLEGYEDKVYDLMVFEEFAPGSCALTLMNNLTGGGKTIDGKQRYKPGVKEDNLLMVIVSNYKPSEIWPNMTYTLAYEAFLDRFEFYRFITEHPIRIWCDPEDNFAEEEERVLPSWVIEKGNNNDRYYPA